MLCIQNKKDYEQYFEPTLKQLLLYDNNDIIDDAVLYILDCI
jgi:hypothetical protein